MRDKPCEDGSHYRFCIHCGRQAAVVVDQWSYGNGDDDIDCGYLLECENCGSTFERDVS